MQRFTVKTLWGIIIPFIHENFNTIYLIFCTKDDTSKTYSRRIKCGLKSFENRTTEKPH